MQTAEIVISVKAGVVEFAALTIASTESVVMSARIVRNIVVGIGRLSMTDDGDTLTLLHF